MVIWRPIIAPKNDDSPLNAHRNEYRLVGFTNMTLNTTGRADAVLTEDEWIPVEYGDTIGLYFLDTNPIPFTKVSGCKKKMVYIHSPCDFSRCRDFVFRERETGWNPCRIYSVNAEFEKECKY